MENLTIWEKRVYPLLEVGLLSMVILKWNLKRHRWMAKLPQSIQDVPVYLGGVPWGKHVSSLWWKSVFNRKTGAGSTVTSRGHFLSLGLGFSCEMSALEHTFSWGSLLSSWPWLITSSPMWPQGLGWCFPRDPWSGIESTLYSTLGPGEHDCPSGELFKTSWWSF